MPLSSGAVDTTGTDLKSNDLWKVARWIAEITLYDRETQTWYERGKRIIRRYKDERSPIGGDDSRTRYNLLYANTQTLQPALYAKNPKPDIQRRFKDADPVGRVASDVLERSVTYFCDTDHFGTAMRQCVLDYLLPGRGTVWCRYVPHMRTLESEVSDDVVEGDSGQESDTPDPKPAPVEVIDYEEVIPDYVHGEDFGHNICRTWDEVYCVWRKVYLTRDELVERFGKEKGNLPPLDFIPSSLNDTKLDNGIGKATIYELWDKTRKVAVWFHKTIPDALDLREDPLKLDGFFPCPRPIFANIVNDSLIPVPFYTEYQDQAIELDNLTARIASLTKSIKVAGAYDASVEALGRILSEGVDNTMIPVDSWAVFATKGGLQGAMSFLPIQEIASALMQMYQARDQVKADVREISGIPDIVRGDSDPNETLGAQQIKVSYSTNRISDSQREIQRFARETIRIMVDIICGHFQLETIKTICGVRLLTNQEKMMGKQMMAQAQQTGQPPQLPPGIDMDTAQQLMIDPSWEDVDGLIRNKALRCFRIDIETDSTIKADEEADKASRIEFLKAVGGFLQSAEQAGASQPAMVPVLGQMLMFGVRGFPVGKELEGALQTALTKMEKLADGPPKPNPEMLKIQGEQQASQARLQSDGQLAQQKMQGEMQLAREKAQLDAQTAQAQQQVQAQQNAQQNQMEAARDQAKLQMEERLAMQKIAAESDLQLKLAHIKAASAIEVARIGAKADDGAQAEAREVSGE